MNLSAWHVGLFSVFTMLALSIISSDVLPVDDLALQKEACVVEEKEDDKRTIEKQDTTDY